MRVRRPRRLSYPGLVPALVVAMLAVLSGVAARRVPTSQPPATGAGALQVRVTTSATPGHSTTTVSADADVCGEQVPDESLLVDASGGVANVVVTVETAGGPPLAHPALVNRACRFVPRVQVARPGVRLEISSDDPILHSTHGRDETLYAVFNVALPEAGLSAGRTLTSEGVIGVTCDVHPFMRGYIVVTSAPAGVTGVDGRVALSDVPAGVHRVRVWHERLGAVTRQVTVPAGGRTELTVLLEPAGP